MSDDVERAYRQLMQKVYIDHAEEELQIWALSEKEVGGDEWELLCDLAGVDAETFANMVKYMRRIALRDIGEMAA